MSSEVIIYLGPARSGKTHELVRQYREILRLARPTGRVGVSLWLAPTARAAALVRQQLLADDLDACLDPGVVTFGELTTLILASAQSRLRLITAASQRELLRRVVASARSSGQLPLYAGVAGSSGFIDLLADHIRELKRRDIRPDACAKSVGHRGHADQHRELVRLYADYQQELTSRGLLDMEGAVWAARDALANGACSWSHGIELIVVDGFTDFTRTQHQILRLLAQRAQQLLISLACDFIESSALGTGPLSDQSISEQPGHDFPGVRPDLFAKTTATRAELRHYHPELQERCLAPRPSSWPALDYLAQHLFRNPWHVPPPSAEVLNSLAGRLEIVEAAGAHDEIVQIARRIKRLIVPLPVREGLGEGSSARQEDPSPSLSPKGRGEAKPGEIVVVFRTLNEAAPRVREVFDQFGIPYYLESGLPLVTAAVVKTLLALLRLDDEDWPFRRVVAVVTNNTLRAIDADSRRAADWLVHDLQIAGGREKLLGRMADLAGDTSPSEQSEHAQQRTAAARAALPALRRLAAGLENLPAEATPSAWCESLLRLGQELGLAPFAEIAQLRTGHFSDQLRDQLPDQLPDQSHGEPGAAFSLDGLAWQRIVAHFAALERLETLSGQPPRPLSRRELLSTLLDIAKHESLASPHDEVGRVRVLGAATARTVCAKHVFLAGMSEQAFPSPERAGRLCTEADYRFFARAADQSLAAIEQPAVGRPQEEMLLFYEVLTRADESLTISYPALDDKAQILPPSPYVTEIERTFGEENKCRIRHATPQLSPIPTEPAPLSLADWRVQAVAEALDGKSALLAEVLRCAETRSLGDALDAGLRIVHARGRGDSFGPAEGVLASPAVAARLAGRFGPQHLWSPSQWETYAGCPYKFLLHDVLKLEPLGDLVLETDYARRGSRLHQILADFHQQWPRVRAERPMHPDEEAAQFLEHFHQVIDGRIAATPRAGIDAALLELDRRQILKWASDHFDHHASYAAMCAKLGGPMTPAHFEFRFGPPRPGEAGTDDPASIDDAFVWEIGGERILVTGRIDRIDVGTVDGQTVFNVIDYKSGRRSSLKLEHIESGEQLQLPIYVVAAQALLFKGQSAGPLAAGYWTMAGGFDAKGALAVRQDGDDGDRWEKIGTMIEERIGQFVAQIRRGEFPVYSRDDKCTSRCEFNTVCRVAQIRSLGKTWPPGVENPK